VNRRIAFHVGLINAEKFGLGDKNLGAHGLYSDVKNVGELISSFGSG